MVPLFQILGPSLVPLLSKTGPLFGPSEGLFEGGTRLVITGTEIHRNLPIHPLPFRYEVLKSLPNWIYINQRNKFFATNKGNESVHFLSDLSWNHVSSPGNWMIFKHDRISICTTRRTSRLVELPQSDQLNMIIGHWLITIFSAYITRNVSNINNLKKKTHTGSKK